MEATRTRTRGRSMRKGRSLLSASVLALAAAAGRRGRRRRLRLRLRQGDVLPGQRPGHLRQLPRDERPPRGLAGLVAPPGGDLQRLPHARRAASKYASKAENGWHHSMAFTVGGFPDVIRARPESRAVIEGQCRHCHAELVAAMTMGATTSPASAATTPSVTSAEPTRTSLKSTKESLMTPETQAPGSGRSSTSASPRCSRWPPSSPRCCWSTSPRRSRRRRTRSSGWSS